MTAQAPQARHRRDASQSRRQLGPEAAIQWTGANLAEVRSFTWRLFRIPQDPIAKDITGEIYHGLHDTWSGVRTGQWIIHHGYARFEVLDDADFQSRFEIIQPERVHTRWSM